PVSAGLGDRAATARGHASGGAGLAQGHTGYRVPLGVASRRALLPGGGAVLARALALFAAAAALCLPAVRRRAARVYRQPLRSRGGRARAGHAATVRPLRARASARAEVDALGDAPPAGARADAHLLTRTLTAATSASEPPRRPCTEGTTHVGRRLIAR